MAYSAHMTSDPVALDTAYSLSLLQEYTHTLDTIPLDLSRHYADLRELDAVLSASMAAITVKINSLIHAIEHNTLQKNDRLYLLAEISEEATRLKLGGEDKIRVAGQAADVLTSHSQHLTTLLHHMPQLDTSILPRRTIYPHVAPRSYAPVATNETGRRRRGALLTGNMDQATPAQKRKRAAKDDDYDAPNARSPRKAAATDAGPSARPKNGNRGGRRNDRAVSPAETALSVTSPHPQAVAARANPRGGAANKRNRAGPTATPVIDSVPAQAHTPTHYGSGVQQLNGPSWSGPMHPQLEGPGMPVARNVAAPPATNLIGPGVDPAAGLAAANTTADGDGDIEGDVADDKLYCWCNTTSFGVMVACDDRTCPREWFHITCLPDLEEVPTGAWFCDHCKEKPKNKRILAKAAAADAKKAAAAAAKAANKAAAEGATGN